MQAQRFLRPKAMALAVASAFAFASWGAHANPTVTLAATYGLNGGAVVNGLTDPNGFINPLPGGGDFYLSTGDTNGNSVFFHAYGSTGPNAYFGARTSGAGTFEGHTSVNYHWEISNVGNANPLSGVFSFNVDSGEAGLFGSGHGSADLTLRIRLDGSATPAAESSATVTQDANGGVSCSTTAIGVLAGYLNCDSGPNSNHATGNGGLYSMGVTIGANSTLVLDYDIIANVVGTMNANEATQQQCYGGYGEVVLTAAANGDGGGAVVDPVVQSSCSYYFPSAFNAIARSGDPPSFNPITTADFRLNVPEPGSLALMGVALGGLAAARRRRREKQQA